jgi:hypothetical protein
VKTHYELLGLEPSADAEAIKKAFRREIARYHPDKVIHLGAEFQEMAATRAAELTVAYKTLSDAALREEYDGTIAAELRAPQTTRPAAPQPPQTHDDIRPVGPPPPRPSGVRFAGVRADRDQILKRAIVGRVVGIAESLYGKLQTPAVRGFDLAIVPLAKPRFLGTPLPRVLVQIVDKADGAAIAVAHAAAARARIHSGKSPVVVLLFSRNVAPQQELTKANDAGARRGKQADGPAEVTVVVVDTADWSCRLPPNCSSAVRKLADQLCANP